MAPAGAIGYLLRHTRFTRTASGQPVCGHEVDPFASLRGSLCKAATASKGARAPLLRNITAVYDEFRTGHERRLIGGKKQHAVGDLNRLASRPSGVIAILSARSLALVTGMRMAVPTRRLGSLVPRMVRPSGTEAPGARRCGQADVER